MAFPLFFCILGDVVKMQYLKEANNICENKQLEFSLGKNGKYVF